MQKNYVSIPLIKNTRSLTTMKLISRRAVDSAVCLSGKQHVMDFSSANTFNARLT